MLVQFCLSPSGFLSSKKMKVEIDAFPHKECQQKFLLHHNVNLSEKQICAGGKADKDACGGQIYFHWEQKVLWIFERKNILNRIFWLRNRRFGWPIDGDRFNESIETIHVCGWHFVIWKRFLRRGRVALGVHCTYLHCKL